MRFCVSIQISEIISSTQTYSSPAMSTLSVFSTPASSSTLNSKSFPLLLSKHLLQIQTLTFCNFKSLRTSKSFSNFRTFYKFPKSIFPVESQISDDDEEEGEEEEELEDDDDNDDDIAAEEYDVVLGEVSEEEEEIEASIDNVSEDKGEMYEEFKWQRVERLCNEVREFGEQILDANELASIYTFRIDKFQVFFLQFIVNFAAFVICSVKHISY